MIRQAASGDCDAIRRILLDAFPTAAEADLAERLRADGDMRLELVHDGAGGVDGFVAASAMQAPSGTAGLAPLAVAVAAQGKGVGSALARAAIEALRGNRFAAVFVLGDPAFYSRFGFSVDCARPFDTPYPKEFMMALELTRSALRGLSSPLRYARAFDSLE